MLMNILNYFKFLFAFLILIGLTACPKCPTEIGENVISYPVEFANVMFVNLLPEHEKVNIRTYYISDSIDNLRSANSDFEYIKIGSGDNYIQVIDPATKKVLANRPVYYTKENYYSCFLYGRGEKIDAMALDDEVANYSEHNVYIRAVNLNPDYQNIVIKGKDGFPLSIAASFPGYSEYVTSYSGSYKFEVRDSDSEKVIYYGEYNFRPGIKYSLVIKEKLNDADELILLIIPARVK